MSDGAIRFGVTFGLLALFALLEYVAPARPRLLTLKRIGRQASLAIISAIVARLALAGGLASAAIWSQNAGIGLFNILDCPLWLAIGLSLVATDFAVWGQHVVLHAVPFLWRLHRVHHGDITMDVTTALRFHPLEILASLAFKVGVIVALGAPPVAAFAFEFILGAGALFSHANLALPAWLERSLRLVIITPALHLIHHSPNLPETNSNFGFSLSIWDRLFGTYRGERLVQSDDVGLEDWRTDSDQSLRAMLVNPFL